MSLCLCLFCLFMCVGVCVSPCVCVRARASAYLCNSVCILIRLGSWLAVQSTCSIIFSDCNLFHQGATRTIAPPNGTVVRTMAIRMPAPIRKKLGPHFMVRTHTRTYLIHVNTYTSPSHPANSVRVQNADCSLSCSSTSPTLAQSRDQSSIT